MSKYHQPESFWENYKLGDITVIKKIGERKVKINSRGKDYYLTADIILVKCSCEHEYQICAKSFVQNKPKTCKMCARSQKEYIGMVINNLKCDSYYHERHVNGRSLIFLNLTCQLCGHTKKIKSTYFRNRQCFCKCAVKKKAQDIGTPITPNAYFYSLKSGAKTRNIAVEISIEDILLLINKQNNKCALSGLDISFKDGSLSVDRIDSSKGYILDNIQCVHRDVNFMKNWYSQDRFIEICTKVALLQNK